MSEPDLEALLERQSRRWAIGGGEGMPQPRGPVVAMSRLPQAGGRALASRVAAWLDYGLFGRAEVDAIASNWSLRGRLAEGMSVETQRRVEKRAREAVQCAQAPQGGATLRSAEIVSLLGERGMAVLLGRGATALVPPERALRVLIVAPRETRIARFADASETEPEEAAKILYEQEEVRSGFLRDCFGLEMGVPEDYDLILNTEWLTLDAGAALVVDALRRRFPSR